MKSENHKHLLAMQNTNTTVLCAVVEGIWHDTEQYASNQLVKLLASEEFSESSMSRSCERLASNCS